MFLLTNKWLRGSVLGLMFFLAGTACCWCDSYDPDPYDDTPPVVTVEFSYVVPIRVSVRIPRMQASSPQRIAARGDRVQDFATLQKFATSRSTLPSHQSLSNLVIPLRR
jgi:hypothetical protein